MEASQPKGVMSPTSHYVIGSLESVHIFRPNSTPLHIFALWLKNLWDVTVIWKNFKKAWKYTVVFWISCNGLIVHLGGSTRSKLQRLQHPSGLWEDRSPDGTVSNFATTQLQGHYIDPVTIFGVFPRFSGSVWLSCALRCSWDKLGSHLDLTRITTLLTMN